MERVLPLLQSDFHIVLIVDELFLSFRLGAKWKIAFNVETLPNWSIKRLFHLLLVSHTLLLP